MAANKKANKAAAKKSGAVKPRVNVLSASFMNISHLAQRADAVTLIVECNVDGDLKDVNGNVATFTSLDAANQFAKDHRSATGHKCMVKTDQQG